MLQLDRRSLIRARDRGPEVRVAGGQLGKAEPERIEGGHTATGMTRFWLGASEVRLNDVLKSLRVVCSVFMNDCHVQNCRLRVSQNP